MTFEDKKLLSILKQSSISCGIPRNSVLFERGIWYAVSYSIFFNIWCYLCVIYVFVCMNVLCVSRGPWQPTGVTRSLELSDLAAENWT